MKSKSKLVTIIGIIALIMCAIVSLYPLIFRFLMSFKDYQPFVGLSKSKFVGLLHYKRFLKSDYFMHVLVNSIVISSVGMVFGAVYVFFATLATGSMRRTVPKIIVSIFFALPLAIPAAVSGGLVAPKIDGRVIGCLIAGIGGTLPLAALFSLGGLFVVKAPTRSAIKLAVVFSAIKLVLFFTDNFSFISAVTNSYTYYLTDTFSLMAYREGLLLGEYSSAAAIEIVRAFFSLFPAAFGCFILMVYMKKHNENIRRDAYVDYDRSFRLVSTLMSLVPLAFSIAIVLKASGYAFYIKDYAMAYLNSIAISFFTTVFGASLVFLMANAVRNLRMVGVIAVCILCIMAENIVGQFFAAYSLGGLNSRAGVIVMNLRYAPLFALVFSIFIRLKDTLAAKLATLPLVLATVFSFSWGDFTSSLILLNSPVKYPMSLHAKEIFAQNLGGIVNLSVYVAIPIAVLIVCIIASALIMRRREE